MTITIQAVRPEDLPFELGTKEADDWISIQSEPDQDAIAHGQIGPHEWMDLRDVPDNFSRLIGADEVVLQSAEAILVLSYPLKVAAIRLIRAADGNAFTRGELVRFIIETYLQVYRQEAKTQSSPSPAAHERGDFLNRPQSDGEFGIWGHDLSDLGIEKIAIHNPCSRRKNLVESDNG